MGCGTSNCGSCGGCGGCRREIVLTPPEAALLRRLGEVAFLPVGRRRDGETPVYLEEADYSPEACGEALAWLQLKGLVRSSSMAAPPSPPPDRRRWRCWSCRECGKKMERRKAGAPLFTEIQDHFRAMARFTASTMLAARRP